jgi:hypothetical protein
VDHFQGIILCGEPLKLLAVDDLFVGARGVEQGFAERTGLPFPRGYYGLDPSTGIAWWRKRPAKATNCSPATLAGSRS